MFDLISSVLAAPVLIPMEVNIDPNGSGLPGIAWTCPDLVDT